MKTIKELKKSLEKYNEINNAFTNWYKTALQEMLKDIQNTETTSVATIEKLLEYLLDNNLLWQTQQ